MFRKKQLYLNVRRKDIEQIIKMHVKYISARNIFGNKNNRFLTIITDKTIDESTVFQTVFSVYQYVINKLKKYFGDF